MRTIWDIRRIGRDMLYGGSILLIIRGLICEGGWAIKWPKTERGKGTKQDGEREQNRNGEREGY